MWHGQARTKQLPPDHPRHHLPDAHGNRCGCTEPDFDWTVWLLMSGRGFGKTWIGANWIVQQAVQNPNTEWAVLAPTFRDVRKTCTEGPTGILRAFQPGEMANYRRNEAMIILENGSIIYGFSADEPERLRGANLSGAWADELGSWRYTETWAAGLMPALRIGSHPRVVVTTTPRPVPLIRSLIKREEGSVHVTRGSTWENRDNLSQIALNELEIQYGGTRLGRQELEGELLEDVEGALWNRAELDALRVEEPPDDLIRVVVGFDPAVTSGEDSDWTGIVVMAEAPGMVGYVLEDATMKGTPEQCCRTAVAMYHKWAADCVVAEINNGGDYVRTLLRTTDPSVPFKCVRATRGKLLRAQPLSAIYEQGRAHHVGSFPQLEDQMCLVAGTLVQTARGQVPVERVNAGDLVLTRNGWAPVEWAGMTGLTDELVSVTHEHGSVQSTSCHPIWTGREFAPAASVSPGQRLLVSPSWASTGRRSPGADAGGTAWPPATTGTHGESCSTALSGVLTMASSPLASWSTTSTTTLATTSWTTSAWSQSVSTQPSIPVRGSLSWTGRSGSSRPASSGPAGRASSSPARNAMPVSPAGTCGLSAARTSAVVSVRTARLVTPTPVFNLKVADGYLPEFYADGVLVHNCSWVPESLESPDRLDALVWAATELKGLYEASWASAYGFTRCPHCQQLSRDPDKCDKCGQEL